MPALAFRLQPPLAALDVRAFCLQASRMNVRNADPESARARWIAAVAERRDREAFARLFAFYAPRVKAQAQRFGLPPDAAEDVAQETMLSVWRRAEQFDPRRGSASAWVFGVAANARVDRLRRDARLSAAEPLSDDAFEIADVEAGADPADAARLERLVGELPVEQRRILHLSFFSGASHGDIATLLALPLGTVKSRVRLALNKLRAALGEDR